MTKDVIALTDRMPDAWSVLAGLLAGGPDLHVHSTAEGAVIQLCDAEGGPLVSIEAPLLLQVPHEAQRLLGATGADDKQKWWTEARASTAVPDAERLAGAFVARLTTLLGGTVWPPDAPGADDPARPVDTSGITAIPTPAAAQPAVDVLTDKVAVVLQDRPVIGMTSWLSDALRATLESERALQIVTPRHCRLSLPTSNVLIGPPTRWVVQDPDCGYYDGLTGAVLRWRDGAFEVAKETDGKAPVAPAFTDVTRTGERQLLLSFRTVHQPDAHLVLGGALEAAWQSLAGRPPTGWGTAEPANLPWSRRRLTDLAYERAPQPTWTVVVGSADRPALATLRVLRTPDGVEEDVTLAVGFRDGEKPPVSAVADLAAELTTRHGLRTLLAHLREARADLTVPPCFERPPVPFGFALGPAEVAEAGTGVAAHPPLPAAPVRLGAAARPGYYYPLGDGESADGWTVFETLLRHLRGAPQGTRA
ncbi:hypothetical protein LK08_18875 [Streptomyces sp. MUSC 125]|uniref:DUF6177 family protein n=1 Tax=unclassified Streptomyces TaxID=2593676 RepID=UPI00057D9A34|nr:MULTISPECIES: DUF6177 family protein [unclassified Streptomyces]KIE25550.1 hypothetical protein LK08_18875 [Streptomyces sp. MUSC 125]MCH0557761.1 hypothetical protein [Streptomyces sp. MUM 16J]